LSEGVGGGVVVAEPVGLTVEVDDHRSVQQSVEHRGGNGGVTEDFTPGSDATIGSDHDVGLQICWDTI
jgi:hypothetical protein